MSEIGKIIKSYLRTRLISICCMIIILLIFLLVNYLYAVNQEVYLLGLQLSLMVGGIVGVIDFLRYYQKSRAVMAYQKAALVEIKALPETRGLIEETYRQAVLDLFENRSKLMVEMENSKKEMNDYYTLWAHQIKTPISAMDLILQSSEMEKIEQAQLRQELFKVREYVEMVLQYLRLESIAADMILREYNLLDLVQEAVRKYSLIFIQKKIQLEVEIPEIKIVTDKKWLIFCLEQIISNALKYTRSGFVKIYLEANKHLVIEDTGVGISSEDVQRIFERGFTGYMGRMDRKSTGIGLYLTKTVLDQLNHSIEVESALNVGTKIKIDLNQDKIKNIA